MPPPLTVVFITRCPTNVLSPIDKFIATDKERALAIFPYRSSQ